MNNETMLTTYFICKTCPYIHSCLHKRVYFKDHNGKFCAPMTVCTGNYAYEGIDLKKLNEREKAENK